MREDWIEIELGDACEIIGGKNQKQVENPKGRYPICGSGGIFGYADEYLCEPGTTIIGRKGTINSPIYVNQKLWNVDTAFGISPSNKINSKYIYYFCVSFNFKKIDKSTTIPSLAKRDILKIKFSLAPLPEQRAIVAKIDQLFSDLDNGIANLKAAKVKLEIYRQAVLKKAFEGELTKEWREKQTELSTANELLEHIKNEQEKQYQQNFTNWKQSLKIWEANGEKGKKPVRPKQIKKFPPLTKSQLKELPELPEKWGWEKLNSCCTTIVDCPHSTPKWSDEGKICLRTTNFFPNKLNLSKIKYVSEEIFKKRNERLIPKKNDILYSREGGILGIACILNKNIDVCLGQRMMLLRVGSFIDCNYLSYYINSPRILKIVKSLITGCAAPHINVGDIKEYCVPICSKKEQDQIVHEIETRLSVCDKLSETIDQSLEQSEALRQSILKKAFEGKILSEAELKACRQEPDWEPAQKLLARIKEKETIIKPSKKRKS